MHRRMPGSSDDSEELMKTNQSNVSSPLKFKTMDVIPMKRSVFRRFYDNIPYMKYIFLILITPPILNYASLQRETAALIPKEGELVDMGWGQKMFINCVGEGTPTVILDAPTGATSDVWYLFQQHLSKISKVCVYDRTGLGFSNVPSLNFNNKDNTNRKFLSQISTVEQMTGDLYHLVTKAKPLRRPFILVGCETGGLIARHYSLMHPEDVSDILLLNPFVEDLFKRQPEDWNNYWNFHLLPSLESLQLSAYVGITRIAALVGLMKVDTFGENVPKENELRMLSHMCNPSHMTAVLHEHRLLNTSFSQMSELWQSKPFAENISVTLITSKRFDKVPQHLQKAWQQSQLHLQQTLHPNCKHFAYEGGTRDLYDIPETIAKEVQQLVYKWKTDNEKYPMFHTFREQEPIYE